MHNFAFLKLEGTEMPRSDGVGKGDRCPLSSPLRGTGASQNPLACPGRALAVKLLESL